MKPGASLLLKAIGGKEMCSQQAHGAKSYLTIFKSVILVHGIIRDLVEKEDDQGSFGSIDMRHVQPCLDTWI